MFFNNIIKYIICAYFIIYILIVNDRNKENINDYLLKYNKNQRYILINNITYNSKIYLNISDITYSYSIKFGLINAKFFVNFLDANFMAIKSFNVLSYYRLNIICNLYISEENINIYSIANIYDNNFFFCVEYIKIEDKANFGILIYNKNSSDEEIQYFQYFYYNPILNNIKQNSSLENNEVFDIINIYKKFNELLNKIKKYKENISYRKEAYNLKSSYLQPPLFFLKRDIAQVEGKWNFKNIYQNYFCFCKGDSCLNLLNFNSQFFQSCKYYFYLTIIDNNRDLYQKTHYLLSDFFDENIESSDVFPVFKEMISKHFNAHYLTMSYDIYKQLCLNNSKCLNESQIIYGIKKINGDILELLLDLFLRLKAVITAEKYNSIDNIFYNIDYITYIFMGHGVTYIKSYLYKDYISPKFYNKILLPPCKKFVKLALDAGWQDDNIIKIGYPRWDIYDTFDNYLNKDEKTIFLMFTWRKVKNGKNISKLYYTNLNKLLKSKKLNTQLEKNNVKIFYCFHHTLKEKRLFNANTNNIRIINQNNISTLLRNSSLIITDFSSILFDAIVQKKPLILFIPDGLDPDLENIYTKEYYETINKIKNGSIYLDEVFLELKKARDKIIYYIKNGFSLEEERLNFYNTFRLKKNYNTKRFINYINNL